MTETTKIDNSNHMENTLNTESIEASIEEISENQDNKIQYDITYQKAKKYLKEVGFLSEESFVYPEQVVDDIYRALAADKKHLTGLASKLTDITEVPQENDKKSILKDLSTKKFKTFSFKLSLKKTVSLSLLLIW
ncbi:hypothetical protein REG_1730 [Candidatus Regiella insecticola LSR1]|uniref:Uncharacterized protein n=1 Tax=Candidatus Regiella insecticola LSR1 TaxID=663321 RepID=E0WUF2_9ENTR|nr:hypothetical protein [Candidatus Regiella insecticola]EFL91363.1 hypothetical protein REG_1730 [Candidatus Regiella insecticola LSR1]